MINSVDAKIMIIIIIINNNNNNNDNNNSRFYQPRDNINLSMSGTLGLLGAINAHIDIVDSFKTCALNGRLCSTHQLS